MVPHGLQKAVYRMGVADPPTGLQGYAPVWVYMESPTLAAGDSDDATLELQEGFRLMAIKGSAPQVGHAEVGNEFSVQLYDNEAQVRLSTRPIFGGNLCGKFGTGLFQDEAYEFEGQVPACVMRLTNNTSAVADVQVALYGMVPSPGM